MIHAAEVWLKISAATKFTLFVRASVCVWLVCVVFASLSVFSIESPKSTGLVFCPLQKQWMKRLPPSAPVSDLATFCAPAKAKEMFLGSLLRKRVPGNSANGEAAFFNFLAKGERSFAEMPSLPNDPQEALTDLTRNEFFGNAARTKIAFFQDGRLAFGQFSRPPTLEAAAIFPDPQFPPSATGAYAIKPRGPPFLRN